MSGPRNGNLWSLKGLHILIVDDYPQVRSMLREMLLASGADDINSFRNGEDALEAMSEQKPDIVLCDYNLGAGKDGQQVLEEAREHDWLPYSSIFILVTAENTMQMVMGVVEHEPDAYLTKPFTRIELQNRLRRLQDKKRRFHAIARAVERSEYLKACSLCDEAAAKDEKYKFDLFKIKGDALLRARDYTNAEQHFQQVLQERDLPWARLGLGRALYEQKRHEEAIEVLQQAIASKEHFVAAHDWLARAQAALGDLEASEDTLSRAVALSPKNLRRQKALGQTAVKNGHLDVAEAAYKTVLKEGRNSIFGSPTDYGELAEVYVKAESPTEAGKLIGRMQRAYPTPKTEDELKMAIVEGKVNSDLGKEKESQAAVKRAIELFQNSPEALGREEAINLAQTCFAVGQKDAATELLQHVVRANHEDEEMMQRAAAIFTEAGMEAQGAEIISAERKVMVKLNNDAVALAKDGKLKESVAMLLKAAEAVPENVAINLNAAQTLLMLMQQEGASWPLLKKVQSILRRISSQAGGTKRYPKLLQMAQKIEMEMPQDA